MKSVVYPLQLIRKKLVLSLGKPSWGHMQNSPDDKQEEGVGSLAHGNDYLCCLQAGLLLTMSKDHVQTLGKVFWEPGEWFHLSGVVWTAWWPLLFNNVPVFWHCRPQFSSILLLSFLIILATRYGSSLMSFLWGSLCELQWRMRMAASLNKRIL